MGYFIRPQSEEDLKEQYRKLLIKYDYRSSKNQSLIEDITREYNQLSRQLKSEGVKKVVKEVSDSYQSLKAKHIREKEEENERIRRMRNKNYSNQEIQTMIVELYKELDVILKEIVKDNKGSYYSLSKMSYRLDDTHLCRWFHNNLGGYALQGDMVRYDTIREKLEYALKGRAGGNSKSEEAIMTAHEKSLGQHINKRLKEYEDLYIDPVDIVGKSQSAKKNTKADNFFIKWIMASVASTIVFMGALMGAISGRGNPIPIFIGGLIGAFIGWIVYKKSSSFLIGLNRKSTYASRSRGRVTEREKIIW